jgi:hypothetical protein
LEFAVDSGEDVNMRDGRGRAGVHYAVLNSDTEMLGLLEDKGATLKALDEKGN